MTTYFTQQLYMSDVFGNPAEVINGARTTEYLAALGHCGAGRFADPLDAAGCEALMYQPCTMASNGTVSSWLSPGFTHTNSPWHDNSAESLDAIGFIITDWTGLDGEAHTRSSSALGSRPGGASFGAQRSKTRTMKLNVLLLGLSERALNHLFRWLESTLLNCCDPCSGGKLWSRQFCPYLSTAPTVAELETGWFRLDNVVLLDGPTWEAQPVLDSGAHLRLVSFTLAAGDPCMYEDDNASSLYGGSASTVGTSLSTSTLEAACNTFAGLTARQGASLSGRAYGEVAPVITITSNREVRAGGVIKPLPDLRIAGYYDPAVEGVNPCRQSRIGELVLSGAATSGLEIVVDMAARKITYRDPTSAAGWLDGSWMIARRAGITRRWWSVPRCPGSAYVLVEPLYAGLSNSADFALNGVSDPVSAWTVTFDATKRYSCC